MEKRLTLFFFLNLLFVSLVSSMHLGNLNDLVQQRLTGDDENKNLKLKVVLDSIRLRISDSLYLDCPISDLKPATFMFLRKDAVDFITRFSIQLNDTFQSLRNSRKRKEEEDLSAFLTRNLNEEHGFGEDGDFNDSNGLRQPKHDRVLLNCKWLSADLSQEFGNLTLYLNKPKDNRNFNRHLYQYFEREQSESATKPQIIRSANKVFRRKVGDKVTFFCNSLQPQLKIVWYRKDQDGEFINLNDEIRTRKYGYDIASFRIAANRLTIREIQEADFAEYICRASNEHGDDMISYKLESSASRQALTPRVDSLETIYLRENNSILLNCSITSFEKFGVQWLEYIDCNKEDCSSKQEHSYFFIANNDYYRPMESARSGLISHNKIQYSATYRLNRSDLTNASGRYICMVRNANGLNYKLLTVSPNGGVLLPTGQRSTAGLSGFDLTVYSIALAVIVLVIVIALLSICVLIRKSKRRKELSRLSTGQVTNNLNNLDHRARELEKSAKDYMFSRNKGLYDKSMKSSCNLINNLVATGRTGPAGNLYNVPNESSSRYLNKRASSKFSSLANSMQRLNNTPVPGETNRLDSRLFEREL